MPGDEPRELTEEEIEAAAAEGIDVMNAIGEVLRQRVKRAEERVVLRGADERNVERARQTKRELAAYVNIINLCCRLQNENQVLRARCQALEDILKQEAEEEIPALFVLDPKKAN
jgi:hypothetical protein